MAYSPLILWLLRSDLNPASDYPPASSPGLDRLPLPVSGFPRVSKKTQHQ